MPYTWEDFRRDYVKEHLDELSPEERLQGLSLEEIRAYLARQEQKEEERAYLARREQEDGEQDRNGEEVGT